MILLTPFADTGAVSFPCWNLIQQLLREVFRSAPAWFIRCFAAVGHSTLIGFAAQRAQTRIDIVA